VSIRRPIAVACLAGALAWPAGAWAQTPTVPEDGLSRVPPVSLPGGSDPGTAAPDPVAGSRTPVSASAPAGADELPNTGSDPRLLFLTGLSLVLIGSGLRLRTADAELY
jgi:LPXTG-motif cell wall-anchored protein